jgi:hypothetical protein
MTAEIIQLPLPEIIRAQYEEAIELSREAVRATAVAIAAGIRSGKTFREVQESAPKGSDFRAILREAIPELPDATIDTWIRMEKQREKLNVKDLMKCMWLLPEPEPGDVINKQEKPWWNFVTHIRRAVRAFNERVIDIEKLPAFERAAVKRHIAPLVDIYERL